MCVICYKPVGEKMPPIGVVAACAKANPDGFGFCTPKRVFKTTNFYKFCQELGRVKDSEPCLIHYRWATHGSKSNNNCHPFYDKKTKLVFMHNGILDIKPKGDWTDSETAFRQLLVPSYELCGLKGLESEVDAIIGGSKFAFMRGQEVKLYGRFEKYNGCYYSNMRWISYLSSAYLNKTTLERYML